MSIMDSDVQLKLYEIMGDNGLYTTYGDDHVTWSSERAEEASAQIAAILPDLYEQFQQQTTDRLDRKQRNTKEETQSPESHGLMKCPSCHGTGGSTMDDSTKMEPSCGNACFICDGEHYINPQRFIATIMDSPGDLASAVEAAKLTPSESSWL